MTHTDLPAEQLDMLREHKHVVAIVFFGLEVFSSTTAVLGVNAILCVHSFCDAHGLTGLFSTLNNSTTTFLCQRESTVFL
jgi:hypothetical protein